MSHKSHSKTLPGLCNKKDANPVSLLEHQLEAEKHGTFDRQLIKSKTAHLIVDNPINDVIIRSGNLFIYEQGIVYIHAHLGVLVLPKQELSAIHFYDGDSPSTVAFLILSYKEHVQFYLPAHLKADCFHIVLALQPKSDAYKAFFSTDEYQQQTVLPYGEISLKQAKCQLPDLQGFLRHFIVSSVGKSTICSGVPGSYQNSLCTSLTELAKDDSRWAVLRQPVESTEPFSTTTLQTSLAATWRSQRQHQQGPSAKKMRGSVTVCIDPANAFMQNLYTLPKLLDNCAQGWNNNLEDLQKLIRAINSDVALLLASSRDITRSPDLDLILSDTAFNQESLIRSRYLSCPGCYRMYCLLTALQSSHVDFPFTGNVYQVRGKIQLTDSEKMLELEYVVLSGATSLNPVQTRASHPSDMTNGLHSDISRIVFTGCHLVEAILREWLRGCARQKLHHLDPLPEGWFYNGTHFVSLAGDRSDTHPDLDEFIASYVNTLNTEIDEYNRAVEREDYHDLFD
ncbi:hypothetical protein LSH36_75g05005 [Paralvinella palmiformis]|uniref:Uncharacterized protein n=1 Tax=Paralvinella palmiformis TaxID=53620 RepID=A0AAD9K2H8_9ANNE|nr:hypothetical protein LSH36_75g05005 [Paralvinella palmiformis]